MANKIAKTVLEASVGEHICAFRTLTNASLIDVVRARKALRELIGEQRDTEAFKNIDDMGVLCVLLEEFANFAIFVGEQIEQEQAGKFATAMQRPGNA